MIRKRSDEEGSDDKKSGDKESSEEGRVGDRWRKGGRDGHEEGTGEGGRTSIRIGHIPLELEAAHPQ